MNNIIFFLITYDRLYDKAIDRLSASELKYVTCYKVQKKVQKEISSLIESQLNEWELPWNDYYFQTNQYYEYGSMIHLYKNPTILQHLTHVGILHYDVIFNHNSINEVLETLNEQPNTIFYQMRRPSNQLSLSKYEVDKLCEFMTEKMGMYIDGSVAWYSGWISESLTLTPKRVFEKYAKFLCEHYKEIEDILRYNKWNIMDHCPHRMCGILERMWGFYLVSCNLPLKQLNIVHDWDSYQHHHMSMNGTGISTI
jgi:hypothetical protein